MTEAQLQAAVVELARWRQWLVYHPYDSRRSTPGFPDLVLVKDRVLFVELKSAKGSLSADQKTWGTALKEAGAEYHVWRPVDWTGSLIQKVLG